MYDASPAPQPEIEEVPSPFPATAGKSLLVIEDDLSLVHSIEMMLEDLGAHVEWEFVSTGEEALELVRRRGSFRGSTPFSLVITDIFLGGEITGFDVWLDCQKLYPKMPFVFTSCLSFDRYFSVVRDLNNCPPYMPKPLTAGRCRALLKEYLC